MSKKEVFVTNIVMSLISPNRLSGEGKMKRLLGLEGNIPKTLKPLLRQEVIDHKILNPLQALKKQVRTELLKFGSREPLLGWIVDPERIDALDDMARRKQDEFTDLKSKLIQVYDQSCVDHLVKLREACIKEGLKEVDLFLQIVRDNQPSRQYLQEQITWAYLKPRAISLSSKEAAMVQQSLWQRAIADINQRADEGMRSVRKRPKVSALKDIVGKLKGLIYFDQRFDDIVSQMETVLIALPVNTPDKDWAPRDEFMLDGALSVLSDRERLMLKIEQAEPLFSMEMPISMEPEQSAEEQEPPPEEDLFPAPDPAPASASESTIIVDNGFAANW